MGIVGCPPKRLNNITKKYNNIAKKGHHWDQFSQRKLSNRYIGANLARETLSDGIIGANLSKKSF